MATGTERRGNRRAASPPPRPAGLPGPGGPQGVRHGPGAPPPKVKDAGATIRRLWRYLRRRKAALVTGAVLVVATSGLSLLGPYLLGVAVDRYILPRDLPGLLRLSLLMLAIYAVTSLLMWAQGYVMAQAAQRTVQAIRADLFGALQRLPLRFFDTRSHGDLMSRLTNDVESISQVLTDAVPNIVAGLLTLVGSAAAMLLLSAPLGAVTMATATALTLAVGRIIAPRTREAFRAQQAALGDLNGYIEETIGGQKVVKAFGREAEAIARFGESNSAMREAGTRAQMLGGFMGPVMNGVHNLSLAVVAFAGGVLAIQGLATVGTIAAFLSYARQFMRPLSDIANLYNAIQGAIAGAERVFEVMDEPPETDAPKASPADAAETERDIPPRGEVVFDNVDFSYEPEAPVLRGVSLRARPGETLALIGPTGAGKTTIVNLLTRFYEIDAGRILVDGVDIRDIRKEDLRRRLGIVLQDTFLFTGTVMDNIRYGRLEATDEEVVEAAKLANAHTFIHRLPHGYATPLSERGENLSQGQRQLLAIARAILADPGILILDEATSSVDTRTERHLQEAMRRLMAGRTSFVIAHRLSTIRAADQILVIDQGRIIERGSHNELMAARGFYHRLSTGRYGEVKDEEDAPQTPAAAPPDQARE